MRLRRNGKKGQREIGKILDRNGQNRELFLGLLKGLRIMPLVAGKPTIYQKWRIY